MRLYKASNKFICLIFIIYTSISLIQSCSTQHADPNKIGGGENCRLPAYTPASESQYVLPFEIGKGYQIAAGNCGGGSHNVGCTSLDQHCGDQRYAYDFRMGSGTDLVAVRDGVVVAYAEHHPNSYGSGYKNNFLLIQHEDGTAADYVHLKPSGVLVEVGDKVKQGQIVAKSGMSGFTGPIPHLHFVVFESVHATCNGTEIADCVSVPVTFKNAKPLDTPLRFSKFYKALPY